MLNLYIEDKDNVGSYGVGRYDLFDVVWWLASSLDEWVLLTRTTPGEVLEWNASCGVAVTGHGLP